MKKLKQLFVFLCMVSMLAAVSLTVSAAGASIKLNKSKLTLYVDETATLKATVTGKSNKVTWKSSSNSVATVSNGKITAKKAGKTTITAKANGKTKKCVVTVKKVPGYVKAYKTLLSKKTIYWENNKAFPLSTSRMQFSLAYIDNNSIPELIIETDGQTPHAVGWGMLYTYRNNKLTYVGMLNMNKTLYYYKKKGVILDNYSGGSGTVDYYCLLKNGKLYDKLQMNGTYNYSTLKYGNYTYYDSSSTSFKSITKAKFNSKLKALVGSKTKTAVKLYKNTAANRKKYIK